MSISSRFIIALLVLTSGEICGQAADLVGTSVQPQEMPYVIVERGANHRIWERTTYEPGPSGQLLPKKHRHTELATGMHHLQNGQWVESTEEIDILPTGGGAATNGQMQVFFPSDIYQGVITMVSSDGKQLHARPMGISYFDGTTNVLIAELTNSVGQILSSGNQVTYTNCFAGIAADLVCTYRKRGFESDLVFREPPPGPEEFGLNPATTRLELLTEFVNSADPDSTSEQVDPVDGLTDQTLTFGTVTMGPGKAFYMEKSGGTQPKQLQIQVYKNWIKSEGRTFLVEEVPYGGILPQFKDLTSSIKQETPRLASGGQIHRRPSTERLLPARRPVLPDVGALLLAASDQKQKPGVVLDYATLNTRTNNFTFQADTTYLISGWVALSGTTTIEGGTVLKFDDTTGPGIDIIGPLNCKTAPYRPGVLTSMNDNTVGETISGSTGSPTMQLNSLYLYLEYASSVYSLVNLRFNYAYLGMATFNTGAIDVWDCQFLNCDDGIDVESANLRLHNVLFGGCAAALDFEVGGIYSFTAEQMTANVVNLWDTNLPAPTALNLTNSIIIGNIRSGPALNTNGVVINPAGTIFQTVGAASYYLADNTYRNVGTTNISAALLADLKTKTTYPPIVYSNTTISVATTFNPQAQRNTGTPDWGYHYDPVDYCFGGVNVTANLTFTAGTTVGWFELPGNGGPGYGISLPDNVVAAFNGTATLPCTLARYDTVQEGGNGLWKDKGWLAGIIGTGATYPGQVTAQFTRFALVTGGPNDFRDYYGYFNLYANNCEFWSGGDGGYGAVFYFTNCLLDRHYVGLTCDCGTTFPSLWMRNCTMHGGQLLIQHWSGTTWPVWIADSAFDNTSISMDNFSGGNTNITYCNYNAFLTNANRLVINGANDVILTNAFNWQSSWLGGYYLPTNSPLINTGNGTADLVGLYHFTTQTNQVKETNSVVEIGYHYVAVDGSGIPIDTDGDSIPDYLEDSNGNGAVDSGETDWQSATDLGLKVFITRPKNNSINP